MLRSFFSRSCLLLPLLVVACGSSPDDSTTQSGTPAGTPTGTESSAFANVAPATGAITLPSPHADKPISGFVFANDGKSDITISQLEVTLSTGQVIKGAAGVGVSHGGSPVTFLFDAKSTHLVTKLSFAVEGSTEKLVVTETNATGIVPATGPVPSR